MRQTWSDDRMDDLAQRVDSGFARVDRQFERVDQRFLHVEKKIEQLRADTNKQFEHLNRRIDFYSIALITSALGIIAALIAS